MVSPNGNSEDVKLSSSPFGNMRSGRSPQQSQVALALAFSV